MSKFNSCERGFHLTFDNGVTISVQWNSGNYCENRWVGRDTETYEKTDERVPNHSTSSEIAIWYSRDKEDTSMTNGQSITEFWLKDNGEDSVDCVKGYLSTEEVADAIEWARKYCNHCEHSNSKRKGEKE